MTFTLSSFNCPAAAPDAGAAQMSGRTILILRPFASDFRGFRPSRELVEGAPPHAIAVLGSSFGPPAVSFGAHAHCRRFAAVLRRPGFCRSRNRYAGALA